MLSAEPGGGWQGHPVTRQRLGQERRLWLCGARGSGCLGADRSDGPFRLGWVQNELESFCSDSGEAAATRERCRGLLPCGARSQEKGWGRGAHRAVGVFRFAVRVEKHSFRVFSSLSPPPRFFRAAEEH